MRKVLLPVCLVACIDIAFGDAAILVVVVFIAVSFGCVKIFEWFALLHGNIILFLRFSDLMLSLTNHY